MLLLVAGDGGVEAMLTCPVSVGGGGFPGESLGFF